MIWCGKTLKNKDSLYNFLITPICGKSTKHLWKWYISIVFQLATASGMEGMNPESRINDID